MERKYIKKYGLRYLGIIAAMQLSSGTYKTRDTWYSRKLHGLVAKFLYTPCGDYIVYKNPRQSKCWLAL